MHRSARNVGLAIVGLVTVGSLGLTLSSPANAAPAYDVKLSSFSSPGTDASDALVKAAMAVQQKSNWGGGTIWVDGKYTVNKTVALDQLVGQAKPENTQRLWNRVRLIGTGVGASVLSRSANGPMFQLSRRDVCRAVGTNPCYYKGVYLENMGYADMGFVVSGKSYVWDLNTGAIKNSTWKEIKVDVTGDGGIIATRPILAGDNGAQFHANSYRDSTFYVGQQATKAPMLFTSASNFVNGNVFDRIWAHHLLNDKASFWELRPTSGQYTTNSFRAIEGEQNLGGLIHLFGQNGGTLDAITDWDAMDPGYRTSIVAINPNGKNFPSRGVTLYGTGDLVQSNQGVVRNNARNVWVDPSSIKVKLIGVKSTVIPSKKK